MRDTLTLFIDVTALLNWPPRCHDGLMASRVTNKTCHMSCSVASATAILDHRLPTHSWPEHLLQLHLSSILPVNRNLPAHHQLQSRIVLLSNELGRFSKSGWTLVKAGAGNKGEKIIVYRYRSWPAAHDLLRDPCISLITHSTHRLNYGFTRGHGSRNNHTAQRSCRRPLIW